MSDVQDMEEYDNPLTTAFGRPPAPGWGRPPTGAWPPCPPRPGPWPGGLFRLSQCWDDVKATRAILTKMLKDIIAEDPSIIGLAQPIIGVTDGSAAQPGQVGEYVEFIPPAVSFPATANGQLVVMGILSPGDWDCWAFTTTIVSCNDMSIALNPVPAGFSWNLFTMSGATGGELLTLQSATARALTTQPSLISLWLATNEAGAGSAAGTANLAFCARRRR